MAESQKHGFVFENIIKNHQLCNIVRDVEENQYFNYTSEYDVLPMQIKSFKFESNTIELASLKRFYQKNDDFILVMVGYVQENDVKKVVFSDNLLITKNILNKIRGTLTLENIIELEEKLKSFKVGQHFEAREWAKEQKLIFNDLTKIDIRFKIDSKNQRRIQNAIKLDTLYDICGVELKIINKLKIPDIKSSERVRNKES